MTAPTTKHSELIEAVAAATHMSRERVRLVLDALTLTLASELSAGRRARLAGLGILETKESKPRAVTTGFGAGSTVKARRRVKLRVDQALARAVEVPPSA